MSTRIGFTVLQAGVILALLGGLASINCDPGPGGPNGGPTNVAKSTEVPASTNGAQSSGEPAAYQKSLDQKEYKLIIEQTSRVIAAGENTQFYAEARLYRGLARLGLGEDPKAVRDDLDIAEKFIDQLTNVDKTQEQLLLFRGQMVVRAKLGDRPAAEQYRDQAIKLAPDQQKAIQGQFENAFK